MWTALSSDLREHGGTACHLWLSVKSGVTLLGDPITQRRLASEHTDAPAQSRSQAEASGACVSTDVQ